MICFMLNDGGYKTLKSLGVFFTFLVHEGNSYGQASFYFAPYRWKRKTSFKLRMTLFFPQSGISLCVTFFFSFRSLAYYFRIYKDPDRGFSHGFNYKNCKGFSHLRSSKPNALRVIGGEKSFLHLFNKI